MNGMKFVKSVEKGETVSVTGTVVDAGKTSLGVFVTVRFLHTKELAAQSYLTFVPSMKTRGVPCLMGQSWII